MELNQAIKNRRSRYDLTSATTISQKKLETLLTEAITYTPSAFHSQSSRVILLLQERHQKLWQIVMETLRAKVPAERFASTEAKINSFAVAHGTLLYFEDMNVITALQKDSPKYADNFPIWSHQSAGMLQYVVWTSLSEVGMGASLQHYNPLIDEAVMKEFNVPKGWKLLAQMPFGVPASEPAEISYQPINERLIIEGGNLND